MSAPEPTTATPLDSGAGGVDALPDYAPVPRSALGPASTTGTTTSAGWSGASTGSPTAPTRRPSPRHRQVHGVLGAADVFTASTTFWVMESIRLDLGYGSQMHP